mmetsp:Transcript_28283/g.79457  ORF Transcript_28283/g.79457 Transcript_28283/m.79457 type:complete len:245 (-) Transcript_28283:934-1668(-)
MLTVHLFFCGLRHHIFSFLVVVRDGESQQERRDDGTQQNRKHHAGVQFLADEFLVDGEDGNDKGEFTLCRHGESRDQAVSQMEFSEFGRLRKVGDHESHGKLSQQGEGEDQSLPDDLEAREILDGDLESDACREEDPHQPLQDALELTHERHVEIMRAAEGQTGQECAHQVACLSVKRCRHQYQDQRPHDDHFDFATMILVESCQHILLNDAWQNENGDVSTDDQKCERRNDRHEDSHHGDVAC